MKQAGMISPFATAAAAVAALVLLVTPHGVASDTAMGSDFLVDRANTPERTADYERKTGGRVLAIPPNGNLSHGVMFAPERLAGKRIDGDYARARASWHTPS